jgi:hypothetical protein
MVPRVLIAVQLALVAVSFTNYVASADVSAAARPTQRPIRRSCGRAEARRRPRSGDRCRPPARTAVYGGRPVVSPSDAPWTVLIEIASTGVCTGEILDATHVLTAAHCAVDERTGTAVAPSAFVVIGGTVQEAPPEPSVEIRHIAAVRVHPGYVAGEFGDDVAELTTSEPFNLEGPALASIPLGESRALEGLPVTLFGWGQTAPHAVDGHEHSLIGTVRPEYYCVSGAPSMLCTTSATGHGCPGDSGGPVVTGNPPVLIGVHSTGPSECGPPAEGTNGFTELTDPDIRRWLEGDETPPLAPRATGPATLAGDTLSGGTATCASPEWERAEQLSYLFLNSSGALLGSGSSTYALGPPLVGQGLKCVSVASNSGGETTATSSTIGLVGPSLIPTLSLAIYPDGTVVAIGQAGIGITLRLTVMARGGSIILDRTFPSNTIDEKQALHRLRPGAYRVCVSSTPRTIYSEASACLNWTRAGSARELVTLGRVRHRFGRLVISVRSAAALTGHRARVRWRLARCPGCRPRTEVIVLRANTRIASPKFGRRAELTVSFSLPRVVVGEVPFASATVRRTFHL